MTNPARHRLTSQIIETESQLRALIGEPAELTCAKISDRLNTMTRIYIERSPFVCFATSDAGGNCDISPRGDPAGFVRILDDRTLLVPERPGNRLADSLRNILVNPRIGLLFIVPGVTDTFRVNGRATITVDADLSRLVLSKARCRGWASSSTSTRLTRSARRRSCARTCGTRNALSTPGRCRQAGRCIARFRASSSMRRSTTGNVRSVTASGRGFIEYWPDRVARLKSRCRGPGCDYDPHG